MNEPKIRSAYIQNNYGKLFKALISVNKPKLCVEVGVLDGYSTAQIGSSLKSLGIGYLYAYNLFEKYPYTNQTYEEVFARIQRLDLSNEVTLRKKDLLKAANDFERLSIDFMHVDIANSGDTIKNVLLAWDEKIDYGGTLIFEGGSPLRDEISWMNNFNKDKIFPELQSNKILNSQYTYVVLHPFPSLIICSKNLDKYDKYSYEMGYDKAEELKFKSCIEEDELFV